MKSLPSDPGTYILMLSLSKTHCIVVGKLGDLHFLPGWYAYVGSAMGPGGVAARVNRHLRIEKKAHWHLDYLRPFAHVTGSIVATGKLKKEHRWASRLTKSPFSGKPVKGFGCTDCKCRAHLLYFRQPPDPHEMTHVLKAQWIPSP
ncbi:MAG: GIY-YIG nuclease family protein [Desulfobacteraceae bacterium]|jgi:Uri superfamily endonuclease